MARPHTVWHTHCFFLARRKGDVSQRIAPPYVKERSSCKKVLGRTAPLLCFLCPMSLLLQGICVLGGHKETLQGFSLCIWTHLSPLPPYRRKFRSFEVAALCWFACRPFANWRSHVLITCRPFAILNLKTLFSALHWWRPTPMGLYIILGAIAHTGYHPWGYDLQIARGPEE